MAFYEVLSMTWLRPQLPSHFFPIEPPTPPTSTPRDQRAHTLARIHLDREFGFLDFADQFLASSLGGLAPGVLGFGGGTSSNTRHNFEGTTKNGRPRRVN